MPGRHDIAIAAVTASAGRMKDAIDEWAQTTASALWSQYQLGRAAGAAELARRVLDDEDDLTVLGVEEGVGAVLVRINEMAGELADDAAGEG